MICVDDSFEKNDSKNKIYYSLLLKLNKIRS